MKKNWVWVLLLVMWATPSPSAQKVPVIIIAVDTLRADHMGCYGYYRNTTPHLDELAADGVVFTRCFASAPLTVPSFATMMTSLPPYRHGAKRNGFALFDSILTLPMILQQSGYRTVGFISNWPLKDSLSGLGRGFDVYREVFDRKRVMGVLEAEGKAESVNRDVFAWLDGADLNDGDPLFLWVHYTDPHALYRYHPEFDHGYRQSLKSAHPPGSDYDKIRDYDTEIGYVDHHIGLLLQRLKKEGLYDSSLILFVSDHGESFGEHDYFRHGRKLYNSSLHVAMIIKPPGGSKKERVDRVVSLGDLPPTVLHYCGLKTPQWMEGQDILKRKIQDRPLVAEVYNKLPAVRKGDLYKRKVTPRRLSIIREGTKIILNDDNIIEAYNLEKDWFETRNVFSWAHPVMKESARMLIEKSGEIRDFIRLSKKKYKRKNNISREDWEKLKSLGYIGGEEEEEKK